MYLMGTDVKLVNTPLSFIYPSFLQYYYYNIYVTLGLIIEIHSQ